MDLQIHQRERLLHVLDVRRCIVKVALAGSQVDAKCCNLASRSETGTE